MTCAPVPAFPWTVQGRPYIAVQAQLPYKQDKVHTVLDVAADEHLAPEREGLAYLEVIKQVRNECICNLCPLCNIRILIHADIETLRDAAALVQRSKHTYCVMCC